MDKIEEFYAEKGRDKYGEQPQDIEAYQHKQAIKAVFVGLS